MFNSFWFNNLNKPFLSLPNEIFAPVWSVLYTLIFISLVFYVFKKETNKKQGYIYFFTQLILNLLWAPSFFIFKNISLALIIIIFLDIFVFLTIKKFYSVSKISGILLIPYFIWILFATYLNIGYLILN